MPSMSQLTETLTKKRKHLSLEPSASPSKKSKHAKNKAKKKDGKGKSKASGGGSEFRLVNASLVVSIPPVFANNPRAGVEEMLDSMVMRYDFSTNTYEGFRDLNWGRYIPTFEGVVLAHSNLHFLDRRATIKADCPFAVCNVGFDATVWSPHIGMKLGTSLTPS
jgi:DNA-directed RNA polymerase I subunit RPA43